MRSVFFGHYTPTDEERKRLWKEAILVPDTNSLLYLFKLMPKARDEMLAAFKTFDKRLWLPHQVGKEFQERWRSAAKSNRDEYEKLKADFKASNGKITVSLNNFKRYHSWEDGALIAQLPELFDKILKEVDATIAKLPDPVGTFEAIAALFDGKVASEPKPAEFDLRVKEADRRRKAKIPPGYMDERPGDYLIWAEIIAKAKSDKVPVLLVTDDNKEDWWWKGPSDETLGPRPELRYEFFAATGELFYAYRPARFLALVRESNSALVSDATVQEIQRVQNRRLAAASSMRIRSRIRDLSEQILRKPGAHEESVITYAMNIATLINLIGPATAARAEKKITGDDPAELQRLVDEYKSEVRQSVIYSGDDDIGAGNISLFDRLVHLLRDGEYWNEAPNVMDRLASTRELRERVEEIRQLRDPQGRGAT
ncbi:PIN-like domain-containing protein [Mesorhizobium sp. WSM3873]|uniref:PIN-like domain-containing protein n=1 Tax=Mesorhizobium sp. WSM3873 TaxID=1854056 RepID=UPI0007FDAAB9|nr:PIN-like domain-containing protein [Mesorhizobium sp. WSM3873]OBQ77393.1 hypothetical protein A9K71_10210 [Mesorhizobium sp. WSM3873]